MSCEHKSNPPPPGHWARVFIALGANLGDRRSTLTAAAERISALPDVRGLQLSSVHETRAVGGPSGQPDYLNAAATFETTRPPRALLGTLLKIECDFGRTRNERNAARTLDIDLLLYDELMFNEPGLTLPHPRMWEREFVMRPLSELADVAALRRRWSIA